MPIKLTNLPSEVLQHIFRLFSLRDADQLIQVDSIRRADQDLVKRKCRQYRTVEIEGSKTSSEHEDELSYSCPFKALRDIRRHPSILEHIDSLTIRKKWTKGLYSLPTYRNLVGYGVDATPDDVRTVRYWAFMRLFNPAMQAEESASLRTKECV